MASVLLNVTGWLSSGREVVWLPVPLLILVLFTKPIAEAYLRMRDRLAYRALLRDARRTLRHSARETGRSAGPAGPAGASDTDPEEDAGGA